MVVFDSSTIILLAKINILELFISNYPGKVIIPQKVKLDVYSGEKEETPLIVKLIEDKSIEVIKVKNKRQMNKLKEDFNIDAGEAEALTLAIQEGASIVGTDDRNAIRACKILRLDFVTAIAILIRTLEKDLIDRDEALLKLQKLQSIGRYNRKIIEDAIKHIKEDI